MQKHKHLFIIPKGVYLAADLGEVKATIAGLEEMGLCHLPYEHDVYIEISAREIVGYHGRAVSDEIEEMASVVFGPFGDNAVPDAIIENRRTGYRDTLLREPMQEDALACIIYARALLITLLATRNAIKTTRERKTAKFGIGKKHPRNRYAYTTTITLPAECEDDHEHHPTGATKAPHLRRGHIRRQHYGPGGQFEKKIWIAPVFVNADPAFVNNRRAYNITPTIQPAP